MLPDVGFTEFLVVAVVALIVVGPRDLPRLMRQIGGFVRQARGMAREFQKSFEDMGREVELDDLRQEVEALKRGVMLEDVKDEITKVSADLNADMKAVDRDIRATTAAPLPPKSTTALPTASTPASAPGSVLGDAPGETPGETPVPAPDSETPDSETPDSDTPDSDTSDSDTSASAAPARETAPADKATARDETGAD